MEKKFSFLNYENTEMCITSIFKNHTFPRKQQKSLTHLIMQILLMFPVGSDMLYV